MSIPCDCGHGRSWMFVWLFLVAVAPMPLIEPVSALGIDLGIQQEQTVEFEIPAQPLARAVAAWALATGIEVSYQQKEPLEVPSQPVSGKMTAEQALTRLLTGTGFTYRYTQSGVVTLERLESGNVDGALVLSPVRVEAESRSSSSATRGPGAGNEVAYRNPTTEGTGSYTTGGVTVAGKTPLTLREIPSSVSVVTRQRIEDQDLRSVGDALAQTPGVYVTSGLEREVIPATRGFINRDGFQVDGAPSQNPMPWAGGLSTSDLSLYDRVEFRKGPDGLMQGFGTPGGTVNLVRRRPDKEFGAQFSGSMGRWDNYRGEASVTGPLTDTGRVRGLLVGSYQGRRYYYEVGDQGTWFVGSGGLDVDVARRTTVRFSADYENSDQPGNDGFFVLPDGSRIAFPRSQSLQPSWGRWASDSWNANVRLEHEPNDRWLITASALRREAVTSAKALFRDVATISPFPVDATSTIRARVGDDHYDQAVSSYDANVSGKFALFGRTHEMLLGGNIRTSTFHNTNGEPMFMDVPVFYSVARDSGPEISLTPAVTSDGTKEDGGFYGVLRAHVTDNTTVIIGARYGYYKASTYDSNAAPRFTDQDLKLTPYGGVVVDLTDALSAYASYSDVLQSQAQLRDIDGVPLDPIVGSQYEAGLKLESNGGRLTGNIAYFHIALDGSATFDPRSSTTDSRYFNGPPRRSKGGEIEVVGAPVDGLNLTASYTYNESSFTSYSTYPLHLAKLFANYRFRGGAPNALSLGAGWNYQSDTSSPYTYVRQEGYGLVTARAGYDLNESTNISLNVNNLLNKDYFAVLSWGAARDIYGTPREWVVTLRRRF